MISKCSKLTQKDYKTRHDLVGKMIHWELCKKFKFDHSNRSYMYNPEFVLESASHKIHRDLEVKKYHLISARRSDLVIVKKKKKRITTKKQIKLSKDK